MEFQDHTPESEVEKPSFSKRRELWELVRILLISLIIVLPIRYFIAQPFIVRGASMEPNFKDGEYLVVDEFSYRFQNPQRGDVVILRYPLNPQKFFIKRIVGLPGETVIIEQGIVKIKRGGEIMTLEEAYISDDVVTFGETITVLGDNDYFVLGDNREDSADSRVWGVLKADHVVGKAFLRLWPLSKASLL